MISLETDIRPRKTYQREERRFLPIMILPVTAAHRNGQEYFSWWQRFIHGLLIFWSIGQFILSDIPSIDWRNHMTKQEKADILRGMELILEGLVEAPTAPKPERCRMLTVKECVREAQGLSEHTIRLLIRRGELPALRTGEGKSGKLLVPHSALINYLEGLANDIYNPS